MNKNRTRKTVYVGISGGIDSAVSAYILKEQGLNVIGVFLDMHNCSLRNDRNKQLAKEICNFLKIDFKCWDVCSSFSKLVVKEFISEYEKGKTPNPCVTCNKEIKFGEFFHKSLSEGADFIATGHYARIKYEENEYKLLRGVDRNKDQSYFLYNLNQEILSKTIFPLGDLTKEKVREIGTKLNINIKKEDESQDICFIPSGKINDLLSQNINSKSGKIYDIDTQKEIGKHNGLESYTIGQRKGINIGSDKPYFVIKKDIKNNILWVGKGTNHPLLFTDKIKLKNINWISKNKKTFPFECEIQTRYRQKAISAEMIDDMLIKTNQATRAISVGQSAVIYQGDYCLGGGIIE